MSHLKEIDKLEIFVLMDNVSDPFTESTEGVYWNESQYKFGLQKRDKMCGKDYCRSCNGLSLLLRIHAEDKIHTLLFDTGPDAGLAVENAARMELDLTAVQAIVLSHGHFDHYGGTVSALKAIGKKNLPVYIHPELLLPRAFKKKNSFIYVSDNLTVEQIEQEGGVIVESSKPQKILNDTILISGEVPRVTSYELGAPDEHKLQANNWQSSPEVIDERCLILKLKNRGLCVITGCGHTGIVNATLHAANLLGDKKIHFVMGGFHLAGSKFASRITPTLNDLKELNPGYIITGHCTGRQTQAQLTEMFSQRHIPYGVGAYFKFDSAFPINEKKG